MVEEPRPILKSAFLAILIIAILILLTQVPRFTPLPVLEAAAAPNSKVPHPKGTVFFVSPRGSDAWSGKLAEPNRAGTDGPFSTVARARDAIRALKAGKPLHKPVTVYLHGGVYTFAATLVFLPEDSGSPKCPITYAAYPGEKPILSGGRVITGLKMDPTQPAGPTTVQPYTVQIPDVKEGKWYFHQLFVDGHRRQRARSPNTGFYHADGIFEAGNPTRFKFHAGDINPAWPERGDVEVIGLEKWAEFRMFIRGVDAATNTATLSAARQQFGDDKDVRYWVENTPDALNSPGEWYLDRRTGMLSYVPMPGEDVNQEQFIAPALPQLIRMDGTERTDAYVHDIVLRGLTFAYSDWSLPPNGYVDTQAAYDLDAALDIRRARNCRIEQSTFTHLGQYAVHIWKGSHSNQITGNEMTDLGAGGVKVGGWFIPEKPELATTDTLVADNYIHDIGIVFPAAVGVWIGQSNTNTVAHNEIADTFYTAISLGWTWGYGPTAAHDNRIEFNNLYNLGRGLLSDMGCIYSLGVQPGTVENNNICHDVTRYAYGGWGIYLDEGSSHITVQNNLVYRTEDGGFHQHYGLENIIRNNIFALGQTAQLQRTRKESHLSFTFEHNIIYWTEGKLLQGRWDDDQFRMDDNLYWRVPAPANLSNQGTISANQPILFGKDTLEEWQKRGQDAHSIVADPLFVDPAQGNFTLKPNSPAPKIGFVPIDLSQAGRRP